MTSISVSQVLYYPEEGVFKKSFSSLLSALQSGDFEKVEIFLIDNSPKSQEHLISRWIDDLAPTNTFQAQLLNGHGNHGYGHGNNLGLFRSKCDFHLVLNPDVFLKIDSLDVAVNYLKGNGRFSALSPKILDESGKLESGVKRSPSIFTLALRMLSIPWLNRRFSHRLALYECRDILKREQVCSVDIISGCFMLYRTEFIKKIGGFDERYFMYFEDFDLSLRTRTISGICYHPQVEIIHLGGGAGGKGFKHIKFFISSMVKFFNTHGWKLL